MKATARNVEVVCELSPLQEGLLVESLAAPEAALYVEQVVLDLNGPLEVPALAQAWRRIVDRHTILRTSFHWRDLDRPLQVVHRHATVPGQPLRPARSAARPSRERGELVPGAGQGPRLRVRHGRRSCASRSCATAPQATSSW